ncbi:MAG: phosphoenolpyruvate carboxykinase (ATP) [Halobacteriota archaeon]
MSELDLEEFANAADRIYKKALEEGRLADNPSRRELRSMVKKQPGAVKTVYRNFVAESEPTSRAAKFTKNSKDQPFGEEEMKLLEQCEDYLGKENLIAIDRIVGNKNSDTTVRLIVPQRFAHIAYGGGNLFRKKRQETEEPDYQMIFFADEAFEENKSKPLPEKDITIRLAILDDGRVIKIVRNSNYIGEYKKGVFAAEDWVAKIKRGGLFLHGGCREDHLQSVHGDYRTVRTVLMALSANGKTTLTSKILARKQGETSWLIQDDGGTLYPDGSFYGFEAGGIFVKTEGVNPRDQMEIYYGLMKPETLCENVYVTEHGDFDLYNFERTSNGRAVIQRRDFMHASDHIDVDKVDNLILITRGPTIPAISKLTLQQAVALMVVGQAMESSAGDPTQAGKIRSVFFYDPFVAGDRTYHANRFYEILQGLPDIDFYLLNTGGIGEGYSYQDIKLEQTISILDSLLRGGLEEWIDSPTGFKVPKAVRYVDDIFLHPEKLYSRSEFNEKNEEIKRIRQEAIKKLESGLHPDIKRVFED